MVLFPVYKDNFVDSEKNKPCIFFNQMLLAPNSANWISMFSSILAILRRKKSVG